MEVNVGEQRRQDASLWSPGFRRVPLLTLEISRFEELSDESEQAVVRDPPLEQADQDVVVDVIEASLDIAFHNPVDPNFGIVVNRSECGVTPAPRPKTVR